MRYIIDTENKTITLLTECNVHELFVVTDTIPDIKEWTLIPSVIENKPVPSNWIYSTVDVPLVKYNLTEPYVPGWYDGTNIGYFTPTGEIRNH